MVMQDDVDIVIPARGTNNLSTPPAALSRWLLSQSSAVDLFAYETNLGYCPEGDWIRNFHTRAFHTLVLQMKTTHAKWRCVSEGIYRLSSSLLTHYEGLVRRGYHSFCETMLQPIAWLTNHSTELRTPTTTLNRLPPFHVTTRAVRDVLVSRTSFEVYLFHMAKHGERPDVELRFPRKWTSNISMIKFVVVAGEGGKDVPLFARLEGADLTGRGLQPLKRSQMRALLRPETPRALVYDDG